MIGLVVSGGDFGKVVARSKRVIFSSVGATEEYVALLIARWSDGSPLWAGSPCGWSPSWRPEREYVTLLIARWSDGPLLWAGSPCGWSPSWRPEREDVTFLVARWNGGSLLWAGSPLC